MDRFMLCFIWLWLFGMSAASIGQFSSVLWHCWLVDQKGIWSTKNLCYLSPTFFFQTKRRKKNQLTLSPGKRHLKRGNLRYQTSLPLCNHNTPFTADKPHRLCREIFRILFALAWHTEWSHLLHDVIGDWMICFAATATLQQQLQRRLPMLVNGAENPQNCPFPLEFCHTAGGELSHGNKQHAQEIR